MQKTLWLMAIIVCACTQEVQPDEYFEEDLAQIEHSFDSTDSDDLCFYKYDSGERWREVDNADEFREVYFSLNRMYTESILVVPPLVVDRFILFAELCREANGKEIFHRRKWDLTIVPASEYIHLYKSYD